MPTLHIPVLEQATKTSSERNISMTAREAWLAVALMVVTLLVALVIVESLAPLANAVTLAIQEQIKEAQGL